METKIRMICIGETSTREKIFLAEDLIRNKEGGYIFFTPAAVIAFESILPEGFGLDSYYMRKMIYSEIRTGDLLDRARIGKSVLGFYRLRLVYRGNSFYKG